MTEESIGLDTELLINVIQRKVRTPVALDRLLRILAQDQIDLVIGARCSRAPWGQTPARKLAALQPFHPRILQHRVVR